MGKKMKPLMRNDSVIVKFCLEIPPVVSYSFCENERLECEIKVLLGYYSAFLDIIRIKYARRYNIQSYSHRDVGVIFDKYILCISHKLVDAEPTGTLDSCSGTQN